MPYSPATEARRLTELFKRSNLLINNSGAPPARNNPPPPPPSFKPKAAVVFPTASTASSQSSSANSSGAASPHFQAANPAQYPAGAARRFTFCSAQSTVAAAKAALQADAKAKSANASPAHVAATAPFAPPMTPRRLPPLTGAPGAVAAGTGAKKIDWSTVEKTIMVKTYTFHSDTSLPASPGQEVTARPASAETSQVDLNGVGVEIEFEDDVGLPPPVTTRPAFS